MIKLSNITKIFELPSKKLTALDNVSLNIEKDQICGVIGASGAGKSTLIRCVNLLEKPTSGSVIVDGVELTGLSDRELVRARRQIGMIFQHFNLLSSRTVFENVALPLELEGEPKAKIQEKITALLELVGLSEKRDAYPSNLSGGQKQRLSIARAVVKEPDIYIFDDSFSALDYKTDAILRRRLKEVTQNATVLIVAQRVGTIMDADQIIVLDKGEIVGRGRHEELMESNAIYREIAQSQLNSQSLTEE